MCPWSAFQVCQNSKLKIKNRTCKLTCRTRFQPNPCPIGVWHWYDLCEVSVLHSSTAKFTTIIAVYHKALYRSTHHKAWQWSCAENMQPFQAQSHTIYIWCCLEEIFQNRIKFFMQPGRKIVVQHCTGCSDFFFFIKHNLFH